MYHYGIAPDPGSLPVNTAGTVNRPSLVQAVDCRRMISTGVGITLVTAGVILRFAVPAMFVRALNVSLVAVIMMLAGVFGVLLSLLVWGPLSRRHNHSGGYGSGAAPLAGQRHAYQDQPPVGGQSPP
jgi:hypothetical protein